MDIAALSSSMSQSSLFQQVGISLEKMSLNTLNDNSQSLIKMMELSVNPNLGSKLDVRV
jgi:hypothetical protein